MRRRDILNLAAATLAIPALRSTEAFVGAAQGHGTAAAQGRPDPLDALWNQLLQEQLHRKPQRATELGLDKPENSALKSRLNDRSPDGRAADRAANAERLRLLGQVNRTALKGMSVIDYETVLYQARSAQRLLGFDYGAEGLGRRLTF
jgi:uncharacterized protein (DUF885 family)